MHFTPHHPILVTAYNRDTCCNSNAKMSGFKKRDKAKRRTGAKVSKLDLKEACVLAARQVIADEGLENLSLREVARKLGVSHQAPYRHYENRDALLIEVLRRCFLEFGQHLSNRPSASNPARDLQGLEAQFMSFNQQRPLEYRLLYNTSWPPNYSNNVELLRASQYPFEILKEAIQKFYQTQTDRMARVESDALFIWMAAHGIASLAQSPAFQTLQFDRLSTPDLITRARRALRHFVRRQLKKAATQQGGGLQNSSGSVNYN